MGTNLFVEGFPSPIVTYVRLPRSVNTFSELNEVTFALKEIDNFLYSQWHQKWPSFKPRRNRDIYLLNFRLSSPPEFSILSDPAWIAVLLTFLTGYRGIKSNIREISNDIGRLISSIRGLTGRELELLEIAIRLTLERLFEEGEQATLALAKKFRRIRQKLIGDTEELPEIIVKDIEKGKYW
jgi:hypothetical protein